MVQQGQLDEQANAYVAYLIERGYVREAVEQLLQERCTLRLVALATGRRTAGSKLKRNTKAYKVL
ncbi:hypothetical protein AX768_30760 (plasmid) [Burkholderia sp. PAMC 28687]|uniref:hypothetical protein n=1 Tax=Burkholderia sp. PAMC 28687 TaxID=1795874 RepID=UPI000784823A|nr:hypothetical protein [Burkholderia sp. PAMC 28687]AMM18605.1 hypothetical protein AX768_30760 [Burkholderia sp. PAMC 28687]